MSEFPEYIVSVIEKSKSVLFTGSKYICPTQPYNDIDIMLLVSDIVEFEKQNNLVSNFFCYSDTDMMSYRYGNYNILITEDSGYFHKWKFATELATKLNLIYKQDRKYLFQQIVDNDKVILQR